MFDKIPLGLGFNNENAKLHGSIDLVKSSSARLAIIMQFVTLG